MSIVRSLCRSVLFLGLLLAAVLDGQFRKTFLGMKTGAEGAVWVSRWCRRMMRGMGLVCSVEGILPEPEGNGLAVVANHLSYLDILVMSAARPFIMVSKSEVRQWPLIGWITAQAGTVYVERADVRRGRVQTHDEVNLLMAEAFRSGLPVLFYPEGTTTGGDTVLPFRRGLFHSVVHGCVPVRAAALSYTMGVGAENPNANVAEDVCFIGDAAFGPHLFRVLGLRNLHVSVRFGGQEVAGSDRFELALNARDAVVEMYEGLAEVSGLPRQQAFTSQQDIFSFTAQRDEFIAVCERQ